MKDKTILIKNIYYMLSYAYRTLQNQDAINVEVEEFEHINDLFAAILSKGIANQIKKGLYKEYIEVVEPLTTLRGKIDITNSVKQQTLRKKQLICIYDEFSENCYMNQVLKSVSYALISKEDVKKVNKNALKKLMLSFSGVEFLELSSINWSMLRYHKNNESYRMLMNICYLTVQGLLMTTEKGRLRLSSFIDEEQFHRLYERFILEYYKKHHPQYKPKASQISWDVEGTIDFLPVMQSDIMLSNGEQTLIIDAKYYSKIVRQNYNKQIFHSANLYQIYAYVKNQDKSNSKNVSGLLLYAKTENEGSMDVEYKMGGSSISIMTLDLNTEFRNIAKQLDSIILRYFQLENYH